MSVNDENKSAKTIAITASFTEELLEDSLDFWGRELQTPFNIDFAPYNQVFQQLIDPSSLISQNKSGMNVVLVRFEDWLRYNQKLVSGVDIRQTIKENVDSLIVTLKSATGRSSIPFLVCVCRDELRQQVTRMLADSKAFLPASMPNWIDRSLLAR